MNKIKPLYIWAGGKNKMLKKYQEQPGIPLTGYDTYCEPFFGGGAMMLWVYKNSPTVKRFVLNDVNSEIIGIYRAIRDSVSEFKTRMNTLSEQYLPLDRPDRKQFYYDLREQYTQHWSQWSTVEESATLYFLMKTGFNGIWQVNQNSNGRFATPSGLLDHRDRVYDEWNVDLWHEFLDFVEIHSTDWRDCVDTVTGSVFWFMDPPYRDSFTQYGTEFGDDRHEELIEFCKQKNDQGDWVFYCNRDAGDDFYDRLRGSLGISRYPVTYTAGRRATEDSGKRSAKQAEEILLYSSALASDRIAVARPDLFEQG
jgi:DNA adenine methylase